MNVLTPGERAALRQSVGKKFDDATPMAQASFCKALTKEVKDCGLSEKERDALFASLCMRTLWRDEEISHNHRKIRFEEGLGQLRLESSKSTENGLSVLPNIKIPDMKKLIIQIGHYAKRMHNMHPDILPDFEKLARDLINWDDRTHSVRWQWLAAIYQIKEIKANKEDN